MSSELENFMRCEPPSDGRPLDLARAMSPAFRASLPLPADAECHYESYPNSRFFIVYVRDVTLYVHEHLLWGERSLYMCVRELGMTHEQLIRSVADARAELEHWRDVLLPVVVAWRG